MAITFACRCGEKLTVQDDQRGRQAFCPKCRSSVEIPANLKPDISMLDAPAAPVPAAPPTVGIPTASAIAAALAGSTHDDTPDPVPEAPTLPPVPAQKPKEEYVFDGEIFEPRNVDRLPDSASGPGGWKLICFCGKHIHCPRHSDHAVGRCPKCGRCLRLPGYRRKTHSDKISPAKPPAPKPGLHETLVMDPLTPYPAAPVAPAAAPAPAPGGGEDDIGTIVVDPLALQISQDGGFNKDAAVKAADRLRAHKVSTREPADGLISAWPLAGRLPRLLAGFIDLTLCTILAGSMVVGCRLGILPPVCMRLPVLIVVFVVTGILNDTLLQVGGGSLGKRLVVLVLRRREGRLPGPGRTALRGILKWLLLPGWLLGLFDPAQRTLHDLLCGTLVLKGRSRQSSG